MRHDLSTWTPDLAPETNPAVLAKLHQIATHWRRELQMMRAFHGVDKHPFADWEPHQKQAELWYDQAKIIVLTAANRWGKTEVGRSIDAALMNGCPPEWFIHPVRVPYMPYLPFPRRPSWKKDEKWKLWILTPDADKREKQLAAPLVGQMYGKPTGKRQIPWVYPGYIDSKATDQKRRLVRVSTHACDVEFISQDQGLKKVESEEVDRIHQDEEIKGPDARFFWSESQARLGDRQGRMHVTLTAVESSRLGGQTPLVMEVIDPGLKGMLDPNIYSIRQGHLDDNTHWTLEQIEEQKQQFLDDKGNPTPQYHLRIEGKVTSLSTSPVFNPLALTLQGECFRRPPSTRGKLHDVIRWEEVPNAPGRMRPKNLQSGQVRLVPHRDGKLEVWEMPTPRCHYTIGVDCSRGVVNGNPTVAVVYNRTTLSIDAMLYGLIDPNLMMYECIRLGAFYNMAWLCVEKQDSGVTLLSWLAGNDIGSKRYPRLYVHNAPGGHMDVKSKIVGYPMTSAADKDHVLTLLNSSISPETTEDMHHEDAADDIYTIRCRIPSGRILDELGTVSRDNTDGPGHGKVIYPKKRDGIITTHCDTVVATGLAMVAANSPTCPIGRDNKQTARQFSDPRQAAFAAQDEKIREEESDGERVTLTPLASSELRRFETKWGR